MQRELYPENWLEIARKVKEDADWKCTVCGKQCRRPGEPFDTHQNTLTVAHLNHNPGDCSTENLMAMCAPCHLRYDSQHHVATRQRIKMTDPYRIKKFCNRLAKAWMHLPNWRFGMVMAGAMKALERDPYFLDDDSMIKHIEKYVESNGPYQSKAGGLND